MVFAGAVGRLVEFAWAVDTAVGGVGTPPSVRAVFALVGFAEVDLRAVGTGWLNFLARLGVVAVALSVVALSCIVEDEVFVQGVIWLEKHKDLKPMFFSVHQPVKALIIDACAFAARASGWHIQTGIWASGSWGWFVWICAATPFRASVGLNLIVVRTTWMMKRVMRALASMFEGTI